MIISPYRQDVPYDFGVEKVDSIVKRSLFEKEDDFLIVCVGTRGTGKTTLMFHFYNRFAGEHASVEQVALTRPDLAQSLKAAKESKVFRFVGYDEANINKREALTKWNRALIDLYFSIRGLRIFHWWNNPSAEMLDKPFIEECVKGLILVFTKEVKRPRLYYYFTKDDLLSLLEDQGNLKLRTLKKHAKKYAYYRGWFKDYTGPLLAAYKEKKQDRMEQKVDDFFAEYGTEDGMTKADWQKHAGCAEATATKVINYALEAAYVKEGEHFVKSKVGKIIFNDKGVAQLDFVAQNRLYTKTRAVSEAFKGASSISNRAFQKKGGDELR